MCSMFNVNVLIDGWLVDLLKKLNNEMSRSIYHAHIEPCTTEEELSIVWVNNCFPFSMWEVKCGCIKYRTD